MFGRRSGILLHVTSLPGIHGIGDLGDSAYEFIEFLAESGQKIWQVLPLNPTGYGDSPYQCFSAFAGNPLFINLEALRNEGLLSASDFTEAPHFPNDQVAYDRVIPFKEKLLRRAASAFFSERDEAERSGFDAFCQKNNEWVEDYALFMACKKVHHDEAWVHWDAGLRRRDPAVLKEWREKLSPELEYHRFAQFQFFRQWQEVRDRCHRHGISIMGDIPIYVAHDSADVWVHTELFRLDEQGKPTVVAGVPPDYFSATGQLWGNPLYRWDVSATSGHRWWIERCRAALAMFDLVRLDHFRGFEAYWEVPATASTAAEGKWVQGPGAEFFRVLRSELKELPFVAENLGVITPGVEALRSEFGFPGMSLLQFAFGNDPQGPSFRPHNYSRELVAYTGVHDNDTTVGWWTSSGVGESTRTEEDIRKEHDFTRAYLDFENGEVNWILIRAVLASVANTAMVPLQDVLGLGSEARMNLPGTVSGNWRWRYKTDSLTKELRGKLLALTLLYDRCGLL
jgi:4-alpha-glucanotransferase